MDAVNRALFRSWPLLILLEIYGIREELVNNEIVCIGDTPAITTLAPILLYGINLEIS